MILAPNGHVPGSFPYGVGYAYGPSGPNGYLAPDDPGYNARGEASLYHDTHLGAAPKVGLLERIRRARLTARARRAGFTGECNWNIPCAVNPCCESRSSALGSIPTDAELAYNYGYTPVNSGWIATNQGYVTGPLNPAGQNVRSGPGFAPPISLGDAVIDQTAPPSANDVIAVLNAQNEKIFTLAVISTAVGGVAAMLAIYRTVKSLREG